MTTHRIGPRAPIGSFAVKACFLLFIVLVSGASLFAETAAGDSATNKTQSSKTTEIKAEPYSADEFPLWARDLRRAEIVAFGSLPFAVFAATFAVDSYRLYTHDWDSRYAPWPIKSASSIDMGESLHIATFFVGCAGSVAIALVDLIIVKMKRAASTRAEAAEGEATVEINREAWPPVVNLPSGAAPPANADPSTNAAPSTNAGAGTP